VFAHITERDDGRFALDLHDDGPGFETRQFAAMVAAQEMTKAKAVPA
jgi:hypothetical protein